MSQNKWNIIFMGTPQFALPALKQLHLKENIIAVYTQPDRPSGRGQKVTAPPIKELAIKLEIPCYQPPQLKNGDLEIKRIEDLKPDLIVVVAYGLFLPTELLKIPKFKSLNIHPSLLPQYRGAAPMQWALINGDSKTGVSIVYVTPRMDAGDILLQQDYPIKEEENLQTLHDSLSHMGAELLINTIDKLKSNSATPLKQDESKVVMAPKLKKEHGLIDWKQDALNIFNLIRGANPWPGTFTYAKKEPLKIHTAKVIHHSFKGSPGRVHEIHKEGLTIETPNGLLLLTEVQKPNRKKMSTLDYLKGTPISIGYTLGNKE